MFPTLPMALIVDDHRRSRQNLALAIRKLELARNVITTSSLIEAFNYLQKQKFNNYPMPDMIMVDPDCGSMDFQTFLDNFRHHIKPFTDTRLVIISENGFPGGMSNSGRDNLISGYYKKPLAAEELRRIFWQRLKENAFV